MSDECLSPVQKAESETTTVDTAACTPHESTDLRTISLDMEVRTCSSEFDSASQFSESASTLACSLSPPRTSMFSQSSRNNCSPEGCSLISKLKQWARWICDEVYSRASSAISSSYRLAIERLGFDDFQWSRFFTTTGVFALIGLVSSSPLSLEKGFRILTFQPLSYEKAHFFTFQWSKLPVFLLRLINILYASSQLYYHTPWAQYKESIRALIIKLCQCDEQISLKEVNDPSNLNFNLSAKDAHKRIPLVERNPNEGVTTPAQPITIFRGDESCVGQDWIEVEECERT